MFSFLAHYRTSPVTHWRRVRDSVADLKQREPVLMAQRDEGSSGLVTWWLSGLFVFGVVYFVSVVAFWRFA